MILWWAELCLLCWQKSQVASGARLPQDPTTLSEATNLMGLELKTHRVKKEERMKTHINAVAALIPINTYRNLSVPATFADWEKNMENKMSFFLTESNGSHKERFSDLGEVILGLLVNLWTHNKCHHHLGARKLWQAHPPWGAKQECPMQFRPLIDSHFIWHLQEYTKTGKRCSDGCLYGLVMGYKKCLGGTWLKKWFNTKWNTFMGWPQRPLWL